MLYFLFVLAVYALAESTPCCSVFLAWYDLWVGVFYDSKKRVIYLFLIPCVGVRWYLPHRGE